MVLMVDIRDDLFCGTAVSGGEGLVACAEDVGSGVGDGMSSDFVEFASHGEAEGVHIEIVFVIVEGVLNFLSDFEETEKEERGEAGTWYSHPAHGRDNLEGQEQQVEPQ